MVSFTLRSLAGGQLVSLKGSKLLVITIKLFSLISSLSPESSHPVLCLTGISKPYKNMDLGAIF